MSWWQTKLESLLPTTLSRWTIALGVPLASTPFLLPDFLFAWIPPSPATVTWLGKSTLALLVLLLSALIALCSVLYECYHKTVDAKAALNEARARVNKRYGSS